MTLNFTHDYYYYYLTSTPIFKIVKNNSSTDCMHPIYSASLVFLILKTSDRIAQQRMAISIIAIISIHHSQLAFLKLASEVVPKLLLLLALYVMECGNVLRKQEEPQPTV